LRKFENVPQIDAPLIPNPMVGHGAGLQQLHEERPGKAEENRRALSGNCPIVVQ
jgi:hypothetical protein